MNKFSEDPLQGMKEACEFAEGKASTARVHVVETPDAPAAAYLQAIARQPHVIREALRQV